MDSGGIPETVTPEGWNYFTELKTELKKEYRR